MYADPPFQQKSMHSIWVKDGKVKNSNESSRDSASSSASSFMEAPLVLTLSSRAQGKSALIIHDVPNIS
jgi:hypothetical protein